MYKIKATELRAALAAISEAEKNGFQHCEAVFQPGHVAGVFVHLTYSDLSEKAHPTDPSLDFGRFQGVSSRFQFRDGQLIPNEQL